MFGLRTPELVVILVIILLVFGASRLPQIGASLGKGIRAFRKSVGGENEASVRRSTRRRRSTKHPPQQSA